MENGFVEKWWQSKLRQPYEMQPKHSAAFSLLNEDSFPLVDLGAGNGVFLKTIEDNFSGKELINCKGIELSKFAIENKVCCATIEQGSILDWYPKEKNVKTVSLVDVIEHLYNPEELLKHVLSYSNYVLIVCPNFNFFKARMEVLLGKIPFQNKPRRGGHVYWCQYESLLGLFERCGLKVISERHLFPKNHWKISRSIGVLRPSFFAHEFVFLLQKF